MDTTKYISKLMFDLRYGKNVYGNKKKIEVVINKFSELPSGKEAMQMVEDSIATKWLKQHPDIALSRLARFEKARIAEMVQKKKPTPVLALQKLSYEKKIEKPKAILALEKLTKRSRGRPRKIEEIIEVKRPRGRPRKVEELEAA